MESLMQFIWTISWQTALVAGVVWLICRAAGRAPASWKCALWVVVLVKFLVPPFAYLPSSLAFWQHTTPLALSPMPVADAPMPSVPAAMDADRPALRTVTPPVSAESAAPISSPSTMDLLTMAWALSVCAMIVRLVVLHRRQAGLVRESLPTDDGLREMLRDAASRLSVRNPPDVRLSESIPTPVLVGLIRPVILLPCGIGESCAAPDLHAMLMHELAHVRRWDVALSWFHQVVQAIFVFHPAAWLAGRELRMHRELACDELVLSTPGVDRHEYAEGYLSALKLANGQPTRTMALAMAEPFEIEKRRLAMIVNGTTPMMSRRWLALLAGMVLVGVPTFAGVTPTHDGREDSCKANMRSLGKMLWRYADSHGGWLPSQGGQQWALQARDSLTSIPVLFCPNDRAASNERMRVARESGIRPDGSAILDELYLRRLTMTDYDLPEMTGGMRIRDLPKDAVLLEERGPGHGGKWLRLHVDLTFSEADVPASEATSTPARSAPASASSDSRSEILAGLTALEGPGLEVTLQDSRKRPAKGMPMEIVQYYRIHDSDLRDFVNLLFASGAEAISIKDARGEHRVILTTGIICTNGTIRVDGMPMSSPFIIRAIGSPDVLVQALRTSGGFMEEWRTGLLTHDVVDSMVRLSRKQSLTVPAYSGRTSLHFARIVRPAR